jgi:DNA-binding response OmpR family regulator/HPt (histidine-containing phosphotransfer) domain-containing protein
LCGLKILFVEDDVHSCELIAATLNIHRYVVDVVSDGEAGLEMAMQWPYDLLLLDVMLPKLNGIEVCRQLRARACQLPILMLTARGANEDVVAGLDAGADDYVMKPCDPDQLVARMRALLRRGQVHSTPLLRWGELCLDPASAQVTFNQSVVSCRPKEYTLLELFLRHPQRLLSRSSIIDHLWSYDDAPVEGSVTTLVKDLRQRLKAAGMAEDPIETVYGLGYRLKPEPQRASSPPVIGPLANTAAAITDHTPADEALTTRRFKAVLHEVDANFRASWSERLAVLEMAEQSIQTGECTREHQQMVLTHVHKLVGSLGTFGYDQAAAVAETLEKSLIQQLYQEAQWTQKFSELLADLKHELTHASTTTATRNIYSGILQN